VGCISTAAEDGRRGGHVPGPRSAGTFCAPRRHLSNIYGPLSRKRRRRRRRVVPGQQVLSALPGTLPSLPTPFSDINRMVLPYGSYPNNPQGDALKWPLTNTLSRRFQPHAIAVARLRILRSCLDRRRRFGDQFSSSVAVLWSDTLYNTLAKSATN
jgi:hypothetical protein